MLKMAGSAEPTHLAPDTAAQSPEYQRVTGLTVVGLIVKGPRGADIILNWDEADGRFKIAAPEEFKFERGEQ